MKTANPPAFPISERHMFAPEVNQGMTLRDYFAAKVMQGMLASKPMVSAKEIAAGAYLMADAMLLARSAE